MHGLLFAAVAATAVASPTPRDLPVSMIAATSVDRQIPFDAYTGPWKGEEGASFVKIHLYADQPFALSGIEVTGCHPLLDQILVFVNFDEKEDALIRGEGPADVRWTSFQPPIQARSLTLNLQHDDPCLKSIRLFGAGRAPWRVVVPRVVAGRATASSTLEPASSYDVMSLFDSRYEYAWSSYHKGVGETLSFSFDQPQKITKLKIWNGYQRSDRHCWSNARLKQLELTGDDGYAATVTVADRMGPQEITLPKPFAGKSLKMTVKAVFPGKAYPDLVVSELRFFDGDGWFLIDPLPRLQEIQRANQEAFKNAGESTLLDRGISMQSPKDPKYDFAGKDPLPPEQLPVTLRFRSDGSLFLEGRFPYQQGDGREAIEDWSALGNYEVKSAARGALRLRIFGLLKRRSTTMLEEDCNGCGRDCNAVTDSAAEGGEEQRIFQDEILVVDTGSMLSVTNVGKKKALEFDTLAGRLDYGTPATKP